MNDINITDFMIETEQMITSEELSFENFEPKLLSHPIPGSKELFIDSVKKKFEEYYFNNQILEVFLDEETYVINDIILRIEKLFEHDKYNNSLIEAFQSFRPEVQNFSTLLILRDIHKINQKLLLELMSQVKVLKEEQKYLEKNRVLLYLEGQYLIHQSIVDDKHPLSIYPLSELYIPEFNDVKSFRKFLKIQYRNIDFSNEDVKFLKEKTSLNKYLINQVIVRTNKETSIQDAYKNFISDNGDGVISKFNEVLSEIMDIRSLLDVQALHSKHSEVIFLLDSNFQLENWIKNSIETKTLDRNLLIDYGLLYANRNTDYLSFRKYFISDLVHNAVKRVEQVLILFDLYIPKEEFNNENIENIRKDLVEYAFKDILIDFALGYGRVFKEVINLEGDSLSIGEFKGQRDNLENYKDGNLYFFFSYSKRETKTKSSGTFQFIKTN